MKMTNARIYEDKKILSYQIKSSVNMHSYKENIGN